MTGILNLSRRDFLKTSSTSAAVLVLGTQLAGCDMLFVPDGEISPNVFVTIETTGLVTIIAHRAEMGQGIRTGLPMVVADEMEADWNRVKVVQADGDPIYGEQSVDGSKSMRKFFMPMRRFGASVRLILERAAAVIWEVPAGECKAQNHTVVHGPTGRKLGYKDLVVTALELPVPGDDEIVLKDPKDFRYIGKGIAIVDLEDFIQGKATYGIDIQVPGMKYAAIARVPVVGGTVKSFDGSEALKVPGVSEVLELKGSTFPPLWNNQPGIAVIADNTWAAMKGRDALKVEWDLGANADYDSARFRATLEAATEAPEHTARNLGNVDAAFASADRVIEADYYVPHLAQAAIEPLNATAHFDPEEGTLEVWAPVQYPYASRDNLSNFLGIDIAKITVHQTLLGGGFGRKGPMDFVIEAGRISQKIGAPVKVTWSREDDMQHGFYHPVAYQKMTASIDRRGAVSGWKHVLAQPPLASTFNGSKKTGEAELNQGILDMPFDIPNIRAEHAEVEAKVRVSWFRSVININTAFAIGSFIDEVAHARGADAVRNFLDVLGPDRLLNYEGINIAGKLWNYGESVKEYPYNTRRMRLVVQNLAERGGWGRTLPAGHGLGFAAHRSFLTYVACMVEVAVADDGAITIPRVDYALDCGLVINPDLVRAQFEGGAIFGASIALYGNITATGGVIDQGNFHDYPVARNDVGPKQIYVHMIDSNEKPTGVGEPPVPPFAPALCNAIFNATGKRIRELPIGDTLKV